MADYTVPAPPDPEFYELNFRYVSSPMTFSGPYNPVIDTITCLLCPENSGPLASGVEPPTTDAARQALYRSVTRHQAKMHPEKLYVLTSAGWVRAEYLEPHGMRQTIEAFRAFITEVATPFANFTTHP